MVVVNNDPRDWLASQRRTEGSGTGRSTSESTLVSRTIIYPGSPAHVLLHEAQFSTRCLPAARYEREWHPLEIHSANARLIAPSAESLVLPPPSNGHGALPAGAIAP